MDHFPVFFDFAVDVNFKDISRPKRFDFKNANFESLNQVLLLTPLSNGIHNVNSIEKFDSLWDLWNDFVFAAVDTFVPKVNYKHSNRPPWISTDLAKDINKKKTLRRRIKNTKSPQQVEKFRKLRQQIKTRLRYERRKYVKEISNEIHETSKSFWSFFPFKCKKKPIPDKVTYNGASFSDDRGRAEAFNDFFKSIYKDHSKCEIDLDAPILPGVTDQLSYVTVSVDEIVGILRSLDTKKAIGHDKLPTIVLKECADSLAPSITVIINFSLNKGFQLSDWKKANIPPIFKKGKRECVENYRPVSLLPVISKVQERCVASRLVPHVKKILYPFQHGFQKGKSCVTQLLEVFYDIGLALDRGLESDIIYLDFAKAFDSVCPAKLVSKLKTFGIDDPLFSWFYSYLTGRR